MMNFFMLMMMDFLIETQQPFVIVLTKADKLSNKQKNERLEALKTEIPCDEVTTIPFSSVTGEGVEEIRSIIEELSQSEE